MKADILFNWYQWYIIIRQAMKRLHLLLVTFLLELSASLQPHRWHAEVVSPSSGVPPTHPLAWTPTNPKVVPPQARKFSRKNDKEENEYRWLTWLYQNWKDVPFGELDPDITKQLVPALSAYGRRQTSQSARQAEELLHRFIEEYRTGNRVILIENTAFHNVMNAYSKCAKPERAQKVLQKMMDLAKSEKCFSHLEPDVFSFTILATAWAKSRHPGAAEKAERLLYHMEQKAMNVTTLTYNVVLNAIAVSHDPTKASRAAKIVQRMQRLVATGNQHCRPDLYTYQSWIHACSRTRGGVPQTMEIFRYLDKEAAAGNTALRPNAYCFAAAIHAWAYSSELHKAKKAYELLQDMKHRHEIMGQKCCKPNVVVFTSVINACVKPATFQDKEIAFEIAQLTFEELVHSPYGQPNFLTYAAFLHVCGTTLEEGDRRDSVIQRIFGLCRQYGCVGKIVLQKLEESASGDLYEELLGPYETWDDLPHTWKRRVKGERFREQEVAVRAKGSTSEKPRYDKPSLVSSLPKSLRVLRPSKPVSLRSSFSNQPENLWEIQFSSFD